MATWIAKIREWSKINNTIGGDFKDRLAKYDHLNLTVLQDYLKGLPVTGYDQTLYNWNTWRGAQKQTSFYDIWLLKSYFEFSSLKVLTFTNENIPGRWSNELLRIKKPLKLLFFGFPKVRPGEGFHLLRALEMKSINTIMQQATVDACPQSNFLLQCWELLKEMLCWSFVTARESRRWIILMFLSPILKKPIVQ